MKPSNFQRGLSRVVSSKSGTLAVSVLESSNSQSVNKCVTSSRTIVSENMVKFDQKEKEKLDHSPSYVTESSTVDGLLPSSSTSVPKFFSANQSNEPKGEGSLNAEEGVLSGNTSGSVSTSSSVAVVSSTSVSVPSTIDATLVASDDISYMDAMGSVSISPAMKATTLMVNMILQSTEDSLEKSSQAHLHVYGKYDFLIVSPDDAIRSEYFHSLKNAQIGQLSSFENKKLNILLPKGSPYLRIPDHVIPNGLPKNLSMYHNTMTHLLLDVRLFFGVLLPFLLPNEHRLGSFFSLEAPNFSNGLKAPENHIGVPEMNSVYGKSKPLSRDYASIHPLLTVLGGITKTKFRCIEEEIDVLARGATAAAFRRFLVSSGTLSQSVTSDPSGDYVTKFDMETRLSIFPPSFAREVTGSGMEYSSRSSTSSLLKSDQVQLEDMKLPDSLRKFLRLSREIARSALTSTKKVKASDRASRIEDAVLDHLSELLAIRESLLNEISTSDTLSSSLIGQIIAIASGDPEMLEAAGRGATKFAQESASRALSQTMYLIESENGAKASMQSSPVWRHSKALIGLANQSQSFQLSLPLIYGNPKIVRALQTPYISRIPWISKSLALYLMDLGVEGGLGFRNKLDDIQKERISAKSELMSAQRDSSVQSAVLWDSYATSSKNAVLALPSLLLPLSLKDDSETKELEVIDQTDTLFSRGIFSSDVDRYNLQVTEAFRYGPVSSSKRNDSDTDVEVDGSRSLMPWVTSMRKSMTPFFAKNDPFARRLRESINVGPAANPAVVADPSALSSVDIRRHLLLSVGEEALVVLSRLSPAERALLCPPLPSIPAEAPIPRASDPAGLLELPQVAQRSRTIVPGRLAGHRLPVPVAAAGAPLVALLGGARGVQGPKATAEFFDDLFLPIIDGEKKQGEEAIYRNKSVQELFQKDLQFAVDRGYISADTPDSKLNFSEARLGGDVLFPESYYQAICGGRYGGLAASVPSLEVAAPVDRQIQSSQTPLVFFLQQVLTSLLENRMPAMLERAERERNRHNELALSMQELQELGNPQVPPSLAIASQRSLEADNDNNDVDKDIASPEDLAELERLERTIDPETGLEDSSAEAVAAAAAENADLLKEEEFKALQRSLVQEKTEEDYLRNKQLRDRKKLKQKMIERAPTVEMKRLEKFLSHNVPALTGYLLHSLELALSTKAIRERASANMLVASAINYNFLRIERSAWLLAAEERVKRAERGFTNRLKEISELRLIDSTKSEGELHGSLSDLSSNTLVPGETAKKTLLDLLSSVYRGEDDRRIARLQSLNHADVHADLMYALNRAFDTPAKARLLLRTVEDYALLAAGVSPRDILRISPPTTVDSVNPLLVDDIAAVYPSVRASDDPFAGLVMPSDRDVDAVLSKISSFSVPVPIDDNSKEYVRAHPMFSPFGVYLLEQLLTVFPYEERPIAYGLLYQGLPALSPMTVLSRFQPLLVVPVFGERADILNSSQIFDRPLTFASSPTETTDAQALTDWESRPVRADEVEVASGHSLLLRGSQLPFLEQLSHERAWETAGDESSPVALQARFKPLTWMTFDPAKHKLPLPIAQNSSSTDVGTSVESIQVAPSLVVLLRHFDELMDPSAHLLPLSGGLHTLLAREAHLSDKDYATLTTAEVDELRMLKMTLLSMRTLSLISDRTRLFATVLRMSRIIDDHRLLNPPSIYQTNLGSESTEHNAYVENENSREVTMRLSANNRFQLSYGSAQDASALTESVELSEPKSSANPDIDFGIEPLEVSDDTFSFLRGLAAEIHNSSQDSAEQSTVHHDLPLSLSRLRTLQKQYHNRLSNPMAALSAQLRKENAINVEAYNRLTEECIRDPQLLAKGARLNFMKHSLSPATIYPPTPEPSAPPKGGRMRKPEFIVPTKPVFLPYSQHVMLGSDLMNRLIESMKSDAETLARIESLIASIKDSGVVVDDSTHFSDHARSEVAFSHNSPVNNRVGVLNSPFAGSLSTIVLPSGRAYLPGLAYSPPAAAQVELEALSALLANQLGPAAYYLLQPLLFAIMNGLLSVEHLVAVAFASNAKLGGLSRQLSLAVSTDLELQAMKQSLVSSLPDDLAAGTDAIAANVLAATGATTVPSASSDTGLDPDMLTSDLLSPPSVDSELNSNTNSEAASEVAVSGTAHGTSPALKGSTSSSSNPLLSLLYPSVAPLLASPATTPISNIFQASKLTTDAYHNIIRPLRMMESTFKASFVLQLIKRAREDSVFASNLVHSQSAAEESFCLDYMRSLQSRLYPSVSSLLTHSLQEGATARLSSTRALELFTVQLFQALVSQFAASLTTAMGLSPKPAAPSKGPKKGNFKEILSPLEHAVLQQAQQAAAMVVREGLRMAGSKGAAAVAAVPSVIRKPDGSEAAVEVAWRFPEPVPTSSVHASPSASALAASTSISPSAIARLFAVFQDARTVVPRVLDAAIRAEGLRAYAQRVFSVRGVHLRPVPAPAETVAFSSNHTWVMGLASMDGESESKPIQLMQPTGLGIDSVPAKDALPPGILENAHFTAHLGSRSLNESAIPSDSNPNKVTINGRNRIVIDRRARDFVVEQFVREGFHQEVAEALADSVAPIPSASVADSASNVDETQLSEGLQAESSEVDNALENFEKIEAEINDGAVADANADSEPSVDDLSERLMAELDDDTDITSHVEVRETDKQELTSDITSDEGTNSSLIPGQKLLLLKSEPVSPAENSEFFDSFSVEGLVAHAASNPLDLYPVFPVWAPHPVTSVAASVAHDPSIKQFTEEVRLSQILGYLLKEDSVKITPSKLQIVEYLLTRTDYVRYLDRIKPAMQEMYSMGLFRLLQHTVHLLVQRARLLSSEFDSDVPILNGTETLSDLHTLATALKAAETRALHSDVSHRQHPQDEQAPQADGTETAQNLRISAFIKCVELASALALHARLSPHTLPAFNRYLDDLVPGASSAPTEATHVEPFARLCDPVQPQLLFPTLYSGSSLARLDLAGRLPHASLVLQSALLPRAAHDGVTDGRSELESEQKRIEALIPSDHSLRVRPKGAQAVPVPAPISTGAPNSAEAGSGVLIHPEAPVVRLGSSVDFLRPSSTLDGASLNTQPLFERLALQAQSEGGQLGLERVLSLPSLPEPVLAASATAGMYGSQQARGLLDSLAAKLQLDLPQGAVLGSGDSAESAVAARVIVRTLIDAMDSLEESFYSDGAAEQIPESETESKEFNDFDILSEDIGISSILSKLPGVLDASTARDQEMAEAFSEFVKYHPAPASAPSSTVSTKEEEDVVEIDLDGPSDVGSDVPFVPDEDLIEEMPSFPEDQLLSIFEAEAVHPSEGAPQEDSMAERFAKAMDMAGIEMLLPSESFEESLQRRAPSVHAILAAADAQKYSSPSGPPVLAASRPQLDKRRFADTDGDDVLSVRKLAPQGLFKEVSPFDVKDLQAFETYLVAPLEIACSTPTAAFGRIKSERLNELKRAEEEQKRLAASSVDEALKDLQSDLFDTNINSEVESDVNAYLEEVSNSSPESVHKIGNDVETDESSSIIEADAEVSMDSEEEPMLEVDDKNSSRPEDDVLVSSIDTLLQREIAVVSVSRANLRAHATFERVLSSNSSVPLAAANPTSVLAPPSPTSSSSAAMDGSSETDEKAKAITIPVSVATVSTGNLFAGINLSSSVISVPAAVAHFKAFLQLGFNPQESADFARASRTLATLYVELSHRSAGLTQLAHRAAQISDTAVAQTDQILGKALEQLTNALVDSESNDFVTDFRSKGDQFLNLLKELQSEAAGHADQALAALEALNNRSQAPLSLQEVADLAAHKLESNVPRQLYLECSVHASASVAASERALALAGLARLYAARLAQLESSASVMTARSRVSGQAERLKVHNSAPLHRHELHVLQAALLSLENLSENVDSSLSEIVKPTVRNFIDMFSPSVEDSKSNSSTVDVDVLATDLRTAQMKLTEADAVLTKAHRTYHALSKLSVIAFTHRDYLETVDSRFSELVRSVAADVGLNISPISFPVSHEDASDSSVGSLSNQAVALGTAADVLARHLAFSASVVADTHGDVDSAPKEGFEKVDSLSSMGGGFLKELYASLNEPTARSLRKQRELQFGVDYALAHILLTSHKDQKPLAATGVHAPKHLLGVGIHDISRSTYKPPTDVSGDIIAVPAVRTEPLEGLLSADGAFMRWDRAQNSDSAVARKYGIFGIPLVGSKRIPDSQLSSHPLLDRLRKLGIADSYFKTSTEALREHKEKMQKQLESNSREMDSSENDVETDGVSEDDRRFMRSLSPETEEEPEFDFHSDLSGSKQFSVKKGTKPARSVFEKLQATQEAQLKLDAMEAEFRCESSSSHSQSALKREDEPVVFSTADEFSTEYVPPAPGSEAAELLERRKQDALARKTQQSTRSVLDEYKNSLLQPVVESILPEQSVISLDFMLRALSRVQPLAATRQAIIEHGAPAAPLNTESVLALQHAFGPTVSLLGVLYALYSEMVLPALPAHVSVLLPASPAALTVGMLSRARAVGGDPAALAAAGALSSVFKETVATLMATVPRNNSLYASVLASSSLPSSGTEKTVGSTPRKLGGTLAQQEEALHRDKAAAILMEHMHTRRTTDMVLSLLPSMMPARAIPSLHPSSADSQDTGGTVTSRLFWGLLSSGGARGRLKGLAAPFTSPSLAASMASQNYSISTGLSGTLSNGVASSDEVLPTIDSVSSAAISARVRTLQTALRRAGVHLDEAQLHAIAGSTFYQMEQLEQKDILGLKASGLSSGAPDLLGDRALDELSVLSALTAAEEAGPSRSRGRARVRGGLETSKRSTLAELAREISLHSLKVNHDSPLHAFVFADASGSSDGEPNGYDPALIHLPVLRTIGMRVSEKRCLVVPARLLSTLTISNFPVGTTYAQARLMVNSLLARVGLAVLSSGPEAVNLTQAQNQLRLGASDAAGSSRTDLLSEPIGRPRLTLQFGGHAEAARAARVLEGAYLGSIFSRSSKRSSGVGLSVVWSGYSTSNLAANDPNRYLYTALFEKERERFILSQFIEKNAVARTAAARGTAVVNLSGDLAAQETLSDDLEEEELVVKETRSDSSLDHITNAEFDALADNAEVKSLLDDVNQDGSILQEEEPFSFQLPESMKGTMSSISVTPTTKFSSAIASEVVDAHRKSSLEYAEKYVKALSAQLKPDEPIWTQIDSDKLREILQNPNILEKVILKDQQITSMTISTSSINSAIRDSKIAAKGDKSRSKEGFSKFK